MIDYEKKSKTCFKEKIRKKEYQSFLGKEKLAEIISLLEYKNKESA